MLAGTARRWVGAAGSHPLSLAWGEAECQRLVRADREDGARTGPDWLLKFDGLARMRTIGQNRSHSFRKGKLMQDYYAARASEYDRIYSKPERQADLRQMEAWLPKVFAERSVLEIACGTGYWTQFYAPVAASVMALDSAQETLRIAEGRLPRKVVRLIQGDAYRLPFLGESFAGAFAGFWWSHIPLDRIAEFLHGLHAALLPGAKVVFLDNRFVTGSSTPISERDDEGNTYQLRKLVDGSTHRVLKNFPSSDELLAAVAPHAAASEYREWDYFWALEYTLRS